MSEFDSDDLETTGYFLPKDSQLRLKKLREYVEFLANLARPRTADELQEWTAEIRVGEVAICLELLEEQIGLVLDEISWPAERGERAAAPGADAEPEAAEEVPGDADGRYIFGITLEQVDTLNRLIYMISAHGDVVIASDDAEFADHTLSLLGDAIFNDARTVREIICQVESQMLGQARGSQTGVGEERAVYHAGRARLPVDSASHSAWSLPQWRHLLKPQGARVTGRLRWPGFDGHLWPWPLLPLVTNPAGPTKHLKWTPLLDRTECNCFCGSGICLCTPFCELLP